MNPSVPLLARIPVRIHSRPAFALLLPVLVSLLVLTSPAHALETGPFGDKVVERGETVGDVYAPVGDVTINGTVPGDVKTGSGDIAVNGPVGGDVKAGWGDIAVKARVGGDVDAGGGDVYIDAPVGGDVDVGHGNVRLGPKASVGGDVACGSGKVWREGGSTIGGATLTGMSSEPDGFFDDGGSGVLGFVGWLLATLGFVACSVLISVVAPRPLSSAARSLEGSPGWSLLFGVASVPAVVVLSVVLVVSVVGIPALLLLAPAYLALVFFGALVAAYFLGRRVLLATGRYRGGDALAAVVGALVLSAATLIPLFGTLVLYALALLGTGAAILALFARRRPRVAHASYEAYVQDRRGP